MTEEKAVQIGTNGTEQSSTKKNYEYDPAGNQLKSVITSSTGATEVVERTYDELGRVKTKAVSNVEGKALYIYDIVTSDGLTAETSIDQKNNITTKVYDKAGRLAFVKNGDINAENIAKYEYYKNGAAKSVIYAGGAKEDYKYYKDGRLESLVNTDNKGVAFESYVYTYDANGNMLSKEDKKGTTTYTYDNLKHLKTVDEEYSGKVIEYSYDKLGNRSTATIKENSIIKEEHVYNYNLELNQLKSVIVRVNGTAVSVTRYEYDANGNQISVDTDGKITTYAYDEFNQLINPDGAKYGYNAEGLRVSKNVNGSLTRYIYEYDKVVLEINAAGNQVGRNIYGTNLLMRIADGQSYYYMYNGHADVTALINAATANIDATYYYDAFGNIVESNGVAKDKNSILYAGYQYDKETGLYYLNARMYDPKIARFLQEDTYTGDPNDPLSLNLYTYCTNNPLIYYDPTGHISVYINGVTAYINPASEEDREFIKYLYKETSKTSERRDVTYYYDNFMTEKAVIEAYDLLNLYISTATSYSRLEMDSIYRKMFMDFQIIDMQNQYLKQLDALQELMLENRAIQSNEEIYNSIYNFYINYELFDIAYANRLKKMLRTNKKFDYIIGQEELRRNEKYIREYISFSLDSIDGIDYIKGGIEIITGRNYITGEHVSNKEKLMTLGGMVAPFVLGSIAKRVGVALKSTKTADDISVKLTNKLLKNADEVVDNAKVGRYVTAEQRQALLNRVREAKSISEAKGIVYATREMNGLGYTLENVSLHYSGRKGIDLVFSKNSKYAVVEAKHGKYFSLLKTDMRGLRQGSFRYNIDRLEKYLKYGDGDHNNLAIQLINDAYSGNLESFVAFYRSDRVFELPFGWPKLNQLNEINF